MMERASTLLLKVSKWYSLPLIILWYAQPVIKIQSKIAINILYGLLR